MENNDQVPVPVSDQVPIPQQPINGQPSGLQVVRRRFSPRQYLIVGLIGAVLLVCIGFFSWYQLQLRPVDPSSAKLVKVTINRGMTPDQIATLLRADSIIRSSIAFMLYTRLTATQDKLQAGTYRLALAESTPQIVDHLVKGTVDQFSITFLPGATLVQDRQVLINAGYTASEVDTALSASYSSPLFANKPTGTTLEGYIYGQTYNFNSGASVGDILKRTFAEFESVVVAENLVKGFSAQGLNLYQGITLASIIQREVSGASDQKQVAQVFYLRLADGIPLGSDVTYIYAAQLLGVAATPTLDSPYNTRIHTGLPLGPIAVPGLTALQAAASPAAGSYLYFLSGDDGKTYFATTEAQHEANITNYCKVKCAQ